MPTPTVAAKAPAVLELEPKDYWWCACGLSKSQPWCDGSHKGTGFQPTKMTVTEKKKAALCQCKRSKHAPMCDGTHRTV